MSDKYKAIWLSHSSYNDFLNCHKAYYLKNIYKDPKSNKKISILSPYSSLGSAIHLSIDELTKYKSEDRKEILKNLENIYTEIWKNNFQSEKGGFKEEKEEKIFFDKGLEMIKNLILHPNFLLNKIIKKESYWKDLEMNIPNFFIDDEEEVLLCGNLDWIEYLEKDDSLHIVDFKTGQNEEKEDSSQLLIYILLLQALQKRKISKTSYWYLGKEDDIKEKKIKQAEIDELRNKIIQVGHKIKEMKNQTFKKDWREIFLCQKELNGKRCFDCENFEKILKGEGKYIGPDIYKKDGYIL